MKETTENSQESHSAPAGSDRDTAPDVSTIVREAESIARGEDPATSAGQPAGEPGKDGDGTRAPAPATPAPSDGDRLIAERIVEFSDKAYVHYFGPGSGFGTTERDIAVEDWSKVVQEYLPKALSASPVWRLAGLYAAHIGFLYLKQWEQEAQNPPAIHPNGSAPANHNGSSLATSGEVDPAKHT